MPEGNFTDDCKALTPGDNMLAPLRTLGPVVTTSLDALALARYSCGILDDIFGYFYEGSGVSAFLMLSFRRPALVHLQMKAGGGYRSKLLKITATC